MATLAYCLEKLGLSETEKKRLRGIVANYQERGFSSAEAELTAVEDHLRLLDQERGEILDQAKKAGYVPTKKEGEVEYEPVEPAKMPPESEQVPPGPEARTEPETPEGVEARLQELVNTQEAKVRAESDVEKRNELLMDYKNFTDALKYWQQGKRPETNEYLAELMEVNPAVRTAIEGITPKEAATTEWERMKREELASQDWQREVDESLEDKEHWEVTQKEHRKHPRATTATAAILKMDPANETPASLKRFTNAELEAFLMVLGAPTSGSKKLKIAKIFKHYNIRTTLSKYPNVNDLMAAHTLEELKDFARVVGASQAAGTKQAVAASLLNYRNAARKRGQFALADANHFLAVQKAVSEGKPVPAEVLKDYPDLAEKTTPKKEEAVDQDAYLKWILEDSLVDKAEWEKVRKKGATDEQLTEVINRQLDRSAGRTDLKRTASWLVRNKTPMVWLGDHLRHGPPSIQGQELVDATRRALGIPKPKPTHDDLAAMSMKELRLEAKKHGIKGIRKKQEFIDRIVEARREREKPTAPEVTKEKGAAKTEPSPTKEEKVEAAEKKPPKKTGKKVKIEQQPGQAPEQELFRLGLVGSKIKGEWIVKGETKNFIEILKEAGGVQSTKFGENNIYKFDKNPAQKLRDLIRADRGEITHSFKTTAEKPKGQREEVEAWLTQRLKDLKGAPDGGSTEIWIGTTQFVIPNYPDAMETFLKRLPRMMGRKWEQVKPSGFAKTVTPLGPKFWEKEIAEIESKITDLERINKPSEEEKAELAFQKENLKLAEKNLKNARKKPPKSINLSRAPRGKTVGQNIAQYSVRMFSEEVEVDAPAIAAAMLSGKPISSGAMKQWKKKARAAGVSPEGIEAAIDKFKQYNKMRNKGNTVIMPGIPTKPLWVVIREGVLNTPAVEGIRRTRLDKLYKAIKNRLKSAETGALVEGGPERTGIPRLAQGLQPRVFLNVPITQAALSSEKPADFNYPLFVTGNPHIINFQRPHPSWDPLIKAIRVKPVVSGIDRAHKAVIQAINYANEIGAKVLITNFRAKHPWVLAKFIKSDIPTDPKAPNFNDYWKPNPNPKPTDPRKLADWMPYVRRYPTGSAKDLISPAFRKAGYETERALYGKGGTWWWPQFRELDEAIISKVDPETQVEYCDLLHRGCPTCRNCQKLSYPEATGAPMLGVTDEPFCEHACPECFVRLGRGGVGGRKGISFEQNLKQQGYGEPDLGDKFPQTVKILSNVTRDPADTGKANYLMQFLDKGPTDQLDMMTSLYLDNKISGEELLTIQDEIVKAAPKYAGLKAKVAKRIKITEQLGLKDIQKAFKGQDVGISPDGNIWVKTRSGHGLEIRSVSQIDEDTAAFEIGYGRMRDSGELISGKYQDGKIELHRDIGDNWTLSHETTHWLEDTGILTPFDIGILKRQIIKEAKAGKFKPTDSENIGGPEDRANYIAGLRTRKPPTRAIKRIWDKIQEWISRLVNLFKRTAKGIVRDIESGKIYEREVAGTSYQTVVPEYEKTATRWYRQMERTLEQKLPNAGTAESFRKSIESWAAKGNFKAEELEWSGLIEWLSAQGKRKMTKDELLAFTRQNRLQVEEVVKGEGERGLRVLLDRHIRNLSSDELKEDDRVFADSLREADAEGFFEQAIEGGPGSYSMRQLITDMNYAAENTYGGEDYISPAAEEFLTDLAMFDETYQEGYAHFDPEFFYDQTDREGWDQYKDNVYGLQLSYHPEMKRFYTWDDAGGEVTSGRADTLQDAIAKVKQRLGASPELRPPIQPTKYGGGDLVEPGGERYRELLLTTPVKRPSGSGLRIQGYKAEEGTPDWMPVPDSEATAFGWVDSEGASFSDSLWDTRLEAEQRGPDSEGFFLDIGSGYVSSHWDEPNVLAHVRFNQRTDIDGKKVLFLEEVQSDWHQEGRKKGYAGEAFDYFVVDARTGTKIIAFETEESAAKWIERQYDKESGALPEGMVPAVPKRFLEIRKEKVVIGAVADAPFKQSWPLLVMKRMIRWAAEHGYDRIAWTPGTMQVARYEEHLRQKVDEIRWSKSPEEDMSVVIQWYKGKRSNFLGRAKKWAEDRTFSDVGMPHLAGFKRLSSKEKITWSHLTAREQDEIARQYFRSTADPGFKYIPPWNTLSAEEQGRRIREYRKQVGEIPKLEQGPASVMISAIKGGSTSFAERIPLEGTTSIKGQEVDLESLIGKKLANEIKQSAEAEGTFKGKDLTIGGEGMKEFYDKILPNLINKFVKKWGAKTSATQVKTTGKEKPDNLSQAAWDDILRLAKEGKISGYPTVHSLDITPEMRQAALREGMPLFDIKKGKGSPPESDQFDFFSELEKLDEKFAEDIDKKVAGPRPPVGMTVIETMVPPHTPGEGKGPFSFSDPAVEARFRAAQEPKKDSLLKSTLSLIRDLSHKITREFEHLPKTEQFAQARFSLLRLAKQKGVATDKTLRRIQGILIDLKPEDYDLFVRKVILDDLKEVASEEKLLPYGYTPDTLDADLSRLNKAIEGNKKVNDALDKRRQVWKALKNDYTKAMKKIGFDVSKKLTRKNYFRHQVLEYINLKGLFGAGKRLKTPTGRGFLKQRKGSELDISADYIQAEHEVMAQMLYDMEIARVLRMVDVDYNTVDTLKHQAMVSNDKEIMKFFQTLVDEMTPGIGTQATVTAKEPPTAEELYRQMLHKKQAIGFDKLGKLAATGELPTGDGQWDWLVDELADNWKENAALKAELGKEWTSDQRIPLTGEAADKLLQYASWLLMKHGGEPGSGAAATIFKGIQEKRNFIREKLGDAYLTWHDLIPEGHTVWQPRPGNVFYMADSIPAALAQKLAEGALEEVGISAKQVRKILAVGGRRKEFVIPNELADTLDNLITTKSENVIATAHKSMIKGWKVWQLVSPRRWPKYNMRNLTGDADALFAGNPRAFLKSPQAAQELYEIFFSNKPLKGNLLDWFERGGFGSTLQAQEMGEFKDLKMFEHLLKKYQKTKLTDIPMTIWKKYWKAARLTTDFREAILRYAAYLDYLEQMKANPKGLPKNYGASIPGEIRGLHDIKDRAFMLSNDLLGAYDRVGVAGQALREHLFPFWSWKEVNFRRYYRMFANAASSGKFSGTTRLFGVKAVKGAYSLTKWLLRATAFWAALQVWNYTRFPKEEDQLPEHVKYRPHIILGVNENGETVTFNRIGALGDLLEWFGLDTAPQYIDHWFKGKMSARDIGKEMIKSPVNIVVQGGVPFIKLAGELISRQSLFPDVGKPRVIRDRMLHVMRSFGLENEYLAISGKPSRPYRESLNKFFYYTYDPNQSAYNDMMATKEKFLSKLGKGGSGFWITPKGNALYNARLALRYDDAKGATKYMAEYLAWGGKPEGIKQSLENLEPLAGMTDIEKLGFITQLNAEEKARLVRAYKYYEELLTLEPKE